MNRKLLLLLTVFVPCLQITAAEYKVFAHPSHYQDINHDEYEENDYQETFVPKQIVNEWHHKTKMYKQNNAYNDSKQLAYQYQKTVNNIITHSNITNHAPHPVYYVNDNGLMTIVVATLLLQRDVKLSMPLPLPIYNLKKEEPEEKLHYDDYCFNDSIAETPIVKSYKKPLHLLPKKCFPLPTAPERKLPCQPTLYQKIQAFVAIGLTRAYTYLNSLSS